MHALGVASTGVPKVVPVAADASDEEFVSPSNDNTALLAKAVLSACATVRGVVDTLTALDSAIGDGDCGASFQAASTKIAVRVVALAFTPIRHRACWCPLCVVSLVTVCGRWCWLRWRLGFSANGLLSPPALLLLVTGVAPCRW